MSRSGTQAGKRMTYPAYRPSGEEWLGNVPQHWREARLRDHAFLVNGFPFDSKEFDRETGTPLIRIRDILRDHTEVCWTGSDVAEVEVRQNDVLVGMDGDFNVGWWSGGRALLNQRVCCLRGKETLDQRYLYYVLSFPLRIINDCTYATTVKHLSSYDVLKIRFALPPFDEQQAVVGFLDRETARIDALIEKKQLQIELLHEKRAALIGHGVTKGLNPNAPMKDSGIEWLGKVPAHWEVGNIRRYAKMKTGHTPSRNHPEYWTDCTIPWFTLADVWQLRDGRRKYLEETKEKISQLGLQNSAAELLPAGTVVFSRTASIGFSGIMPVPMATTQDFWNWICGPRLLSDYLLCLFRAMDQEFEALTMGSTHKTIYQPIAASMAICVPPLDEQRQIIAFVESEASRIDRLSDKISKSITLLREYRTALISAAVTGKIDVRQEAA